MDQRDRLGLSKLTLEQLRRRRGVKWTHYPPDVIPAWVADMDFPLADPVRRAVIAAAERDDFGYGPYPEDVGFREMIATWAERTYGWHIDPNTVFVVPNAVRGLKVAVEALTAPGDGVVIQPPVYPPFFTVIEESGRKIVENPLVSRNGRYELDLEGLDEAMGRSRALMLCHPQNPTGRSFSRQELTAVAELAEKHDAAVISDEIHSPLTLRGATHTVFATLSDAVAQRTMTVTSAAKAWNFGGLQCGYVVAGTIEMAEKVGALGHVTLGGASSLGLEATRAALTEGQPWMDELVAYLSATRDLLPELLQQMPGVGYSPPEATYFAWLDCRALDLRPDPFTFFLEHAKVALSPGPTFGTQGEGFVRLNFATSRGILEEILRRMSKAIRSRPDIGPQGERHPASGR
jgi:cystathionine beta-lyase